jgi:hypothetical protein
MFGSDILDAAIGLFFVYLLFSALCSAINEWIVGHLFKWRARTLEKALAGMLGDKQTATAFFNQPLIKSLATDAKARLSYLSPSMFVDGLIALVGENAGQPQSPPTINALEEVARDPQKLFQSLDMMEGKPQLQATLRSLLAGAQEIEAAREKLESWFNEGMERATGWYKRHVQACLIVLAILVAVLFNVNTFTIARALLNDSKLRAALAAAAAETVNQSAAKGTNALPQQTVEAIQTQIGALDLPIGWAWHTNIVQIEGKSVQQVTRPGSDEDWWMWIGGLVVTAGALSLGAPFWFDVLNKAVNLRSTGKKPEPDKKKKKN